MSVVSLQGLDKFDSTVRGWLAAVRADAEKAAVGMGYMALRKAATLTPQYSGTAAANWRINAGSPDTSWDENPLGTKGQGPTFHLGSSMAVTHVMSGQAAKLSGFQLGQTIYVTNSTLGRHTWHRDGESGEGHSNLAVNLEAGKIELRPVNQGSAKMARRAGDYVAARFKVIGKAEIAALSKRSMV